MRYIKLKIIGIYKITNLINGKIYIGQSIDIYDRWYQHKYKAFDKKELAYNSAIHAAMRKYGVENFKLDILEQCTQEELDEKEQFWIANLNSLTPNGYNILPGGQGNRKAKIWTCEICGAQVSYGCNRCLIHKNNGYKAKGITCATDKPSPLELAKLVKEQGGFTQVGRLYGVADNSIRKWCKSYGIPYHTKELIEWYDAQMGITPPVLPKVKSTTRKVAQLDKDTEEVLNTFNSLAEAGRSLGVAKASHISECCKGKLKTAHGYKWRYLDSE